jgi:hypothetical protein
VIEPAPDDRLSQLMQELGPADPPAGLRRQVMARIAQHQATDRIISFNRREIAMTKKAMYGIAAAAALALGVFAVYGFPPVGRGTEGTIGAAKKYQAPQMASKDVVLGDAAAQEFLQSEVFDRIMKDPEARSLLSDAGVQAALKNDIIASALKDRGVRTEMSSAGLARLFQDADIRAELAASYRTAASAAVRNAANDNAARISAREAITRAKADLRLAQVLNNAALVRAILDAGLYSNLNANMVSKLQNQNFADALSAKGFNASLANLSLAAALAR